MKKLISVLLILLVTAVFVNAGGLPISADNGISYLAEDPNEPGPEFTDGSIGYLAVDPNEPGPEFIDGSIGYLTADPNEPGPEFI
jgi:hypothetical protein